MTGTQLPPLLQPWTQWLSLFPDDLARTLGHLLLRLQPLVAPLRRHAALTGVEPAGIGDIVHRGSYDRLLISEWALADSVPDEFLRRAANNELLFTGPEPANSEDSLHCIALFDAGPAQLGEPRLAHLAMFILLARRAELAGAAFRWGILQQPGILHDQLDAAGVRRLLEARTFAALDQDGLAQWNAVLKEVPADCWLVGDPASPCPAPAHSRVLVQRSWFRPQLDVELVQRRRSSSVALPLPSPQDAVRLLRRPFDAPASAASVMSAKAHSLKRAPMFGNMREWLALGMMDGSVNVYRMPDWPHARPGRPRRLEKLAHADSIVAAGLARKSFGTVTVGDGALHFFGFPGPVFGKTTLPLPDPDLFHAVPGALRWMPAFYFLERSKDGCVEEVLALDKAGRLACWTCRSGPHGAILDTAFRLVARDVIGAIQHADRVLFAVAGKDRSDVYGVTKGKPACEHLYPIMHAGQQLLFGEPKEWRGGRGMYALRLDRSNWLVGDATGADRIVVPEDDIVLGCARSEQMKRPGVVVMDAGRKRISLLVVDTRLPLLKSIEPVAQASFDPVYGRLAWLGRKSGVLIVRGIDAKEASLRVAPNGGADAD
jgi:hypothetical protein